VCMAMCEAVTFDIFNLPGLRALVVSNISAHSAVMLQGPGMV